MKFIKDKFFRPFIHKNKLEERVMEMAKKINKEYANRDPLLIGVLNGSFMFLSDLFKHLEIDCEVTFVRFSSYQNTTSSGIVNEVIGLKEDIQDRDIILVEDIVDTGRTIAKVKSELLRLNPKSLTIITLLYKPEAIITPIELDDIGFEIENKFVIGYGLDYNGLGRNLPEIYILVEH